MDNGFGGVPFGDIKIISMCCNIESIGLNTNRLILFPSTESRERIIESATFKGRDSNKRHDSLEIRPEAC